MCCFQFSVVRVLWFFSELAFFGVFSYVTEPQLRDLSNGHTIIGQDIQLECTVTCDKPNVLIEWRAPLNLHLKTERINITKNETYDSHVYVTRSLYVISKSVIEDNSIYYCRASDPENPFNTKYTYIWAPAYRADEHIIQFNNNQIFFNKTNTELEVHIRAHPEATFYWINKENETITPSSEKFKVLTTLSNGATNYKSVLKFNNISNDDFGNYTIVGRNEYGNRTFPILVNLTGPPSTSFTVKKDGDHYVFKCLSTGFPKPLISWKFEKCNSLSCFEENEETYLRNGTEIKEFRSEDNGLQTISYIKINKSSIGTVKATGINQFGYNNALQHIYKVKNGFEVYVRNTLVDQNEITVEMLFKENLEIMCGVSLEEYYHEIKWFREGRNMSLNDIRVPIRGFDEYSIKDINAIHSSVSIIKFNIDPTDTGKYFCKALTRNGKTVTKVITVIGRETPDLRVASNMRNKTMLAKFGKSAKFYCNSNGYPTPSIQWFKNNASLTNSAKIQILDKNQTLMIDDVGPNDNGTYSCNVSNRFQQTKQFATLGAIENDFDWLLVVIIVLAIVLIAITIIMVLKIRKENRIKEELKLAGLANFEAGAVEYINPKLRIENQGELLPYDKKWEIPLENLTLGKELGSGAFGVVVKAELSGLPTKESRSTVAVKTVNKFAGYECIRALVSELKIMVHLGKHVNIVNLVGACTKDVMKKKLLVVVEFCPFGNLQEYILQNSNRFIDQRREDRDGFDWTIDPKASKKEKSATNLQYTTVCFTSDSSKSGSEDLSGNVEEEKVEYMCSQDFLVWALQISKGMEYLASRNILHGDLAARNVLLSENNVVKISDFGLARNMYKSGIYQKKEQGPLPVKWMAVESIGENIFSSQSDVWSFGVVLWEFFSLAKTPYPGMPVDQNFYNKLFSGYRMEMPYFATTQIYEMMLECWNVIPTKRPTFSELAKWIGVLLEDSVTEHYLSINGSYILVNGNQSEVDQTDYLSMMSSPSIEFPHYLSNINYFHTYQNNTNSVTDKTENKAYDNNAYVG